MISVLIPAYNHPVAELVAAVHQQCLPLRAFEILIADDASEYPYEADYLQIVQLANVRIIRLKQNLGRSGIRNLLAEQAQHELLLFIDGDAADVPTGFIQQYIAAAQRSDIVCGGTRYADTPPADPRLRLRWNYGRQREMRSYNERNLHPAQSLSSFNFLVRRQLMLSVGFDTSISGYGHEDTVLGLEFSLRGIAVAHIDAPLLHTGLDPDAVFLDKTRSAVRNLHAISHNTRYHAALAYNVRLLKVYGLLKKLFLAHFAGWLFAHGHKTLQRLITRTHSLVLLDAYKLAYFCHIAADRFRSREMDI